MTGEVVDIVCYTRMDAKGPQHVKCAEYCAKQGSPLGFLDAATGQIYVIFPEGHGNPTVKVMGYIGKEVQVKGKVHSKAGLKGLHLENV